MGDVISTAQRQLNAALHRTDNKFGNRVDGAGQATKLIGALNRMNELGVCDSVLDYGTGKGALVKRLRSELPQGTDRWVRPSDAGICLQARSTC